jgi:hypothetical protein
MPLLVQPNCCYLHFYSDDPLWNLGGHSQCIQLPMSICSFDDCDKITTNGCEVNTMTDPNNCGGCGQVATLPNANATCSNGQAAINNCLPG